jgi:hypothetical protein
MAAAREIVDRFQPKSVLIGPTNTPNPFRGPVVTAAITKVVATMIHP